MATVVYVYMHALQLNYRANGQRAARHPDRAQRPRAALNYYYTILCYTTVGSKRHQGHRRTRGGMRRDTKRTGGHRNTTRTGRHRHSGRTHKAKYPVVAGGVDVTHTTMPTITIHLRGQTAPRGGRGD